MANRPYIPQEWNVGDIITADKLNILEQAIYDIDEDVVFIEILLLYLIKQIMIKY